MDCQPKATVRTPPKMRPITDPLIPATRLTPIARPRSLGGNASVNMAALLAQMRAAPTPWMSRKKTSIVPVRARLQSPEPIVNMRKPRL